MWHLIKSELLRFRRLGLALAIAHLVILRGASGFTNLFDASLVKVALGLLIYGATGLIFGLYQMGSYKKVNQWTYLIHRPLATGKIFLALSAAAALWFALVLAVPQLLMTVYLDGLSPVGVDLRQYLLIPFLLGITLSFYLAGCFISLSQSRGAFLVALLPYFFLTREAVGLWIFLPQLIVLGWLAYLAYSAFKPDLSTPLRRPLAVIGSALPIQYALFWVLVAGSGVVYQSGVVFQEEGWNGYATHAWNDHFPDGTYMNAQYQYDADALSHGLQQEGSERSRHLMKQTELAEILGTAPRIRRFPVRGQLMFSDGPQVLRDGEHGIRWTFSHDRMLFRGQDEVSGVHIGWLGLDGRSAKQPFQQVPHVVDGRFLVTARDIYEFDPDREKVHPRFQAAAGERLYTGFDIEASMVTALTDRALYFFDPKDLRDDFDRMDPTSTVPLAGEIQNLAAVHVAELLDGYLLSFLYGTRSEAGYGEARQETGELSIDGRYEVVAERDLGPGWPSPYRYRGFIASPLLEVGHELLWSWMAPHRANSIGLAELSKRRLPAPVPMLALAVAVLSALLTWWGSAGREVSRRARGAWALAGFFVGIPAVLSLPLLTRRRESVKAPGPQARLRWAWRTAK